MSDRTLAELKTDNFENYLELLDAIAEQQIREDLETLKKLKAKRAYKKVKEKKHKNGNAIIVEREYVKEVDPRIPLVLTIVMAVVVGALLVVIKHDR